MTDTTMTKKHTTPQIDVVVLARRDAEVTLRAMKEVLDVGSLEVTLAHNYHDASEVWFVQWHDRFVSGDSLDDAFVKALHKRAGTEPPPKEWG